jgi:hypothetical protein
LFYNQAARKARNVKFSSMYGKDAYHIAGKILENETAPFAASPETILKAAVGWKLEEEAKKVFKDNGGNSDFSRRFIQLTQTKIDEFLKDQRDTVFTLLLIFIARVVVEAKVAAGQAVKGIVWRHASRESRSSGFSGSFYINK